MKRVKSSMVLLFFALWIGFTMFSCEKYSYEPPELNPDTPISFSEDVQIIFNNKCISCHGGGINPDLRINNSYNALNDGRYIADDPESNAAQSLLYTKLADGHVADLSDIELQTILYWIQQGAEDN